MRTLAAILGLGKIPLLQGHFFGVNLSNSFDLEETALTNVFEVLKFESSVKIKVTQFLEPLGPIFEQSSGITQEW